MATTLPIEIYDILEKDELTKELVTKAEFFGEIKSLRVEIEGKIDRLEIKLESKMRIYFLILLFTMILLNPKSTELISKLLGILK